MQASFENFWYWIVVSGALGGLVNCFLVGFLSPAWMAQDAGRWRLDPGWIGNIFIGAAAAFAAVYGSGLDTLPAQRQLAIAGMAGIGGGNVLSSLIQRFQSELDKTRILTLASAIEEAIRPKEEE